MTAIALIPAHQEADRIADTVRAALGVHGIDRVVVADDGSTDGTAELAAGAGAEVVRLPRRSGKGAALEAGLANVAQDADVVVFLDADLGGTAREADALLGPVLAGEADMTIAVLPRPPRKAGFGLVKGLARAGIRRYGRGFAASAPLSGQRALDSRAVAAARPVRAGYGAEVAMTIGALRSGLRVVEVPTSMAHRATGRDASGFLHRGRQLADVARTLWAIGRENRQRSLG